MGYFTTVMTFSKEHTLSIEYNLQVFTHGYIELITNCLNHMMTNKYALEYIIKSSKYIALYKNWSHCTEAFHINVNIWLLLEHLSLLMHSICILAAKFIGSYRTIKIICPVAYCIDIVLIW